MKKGPRVLQIKPHESLTKPHKKKKTHESLTKALRVLLQNKNTKNTPANARNYLSRNEEHGEDIELKEKRKNK
jgi:hypothetical protein